MLKWDALIADVTKRVQRGQIAADAVDSAWEAWHMPRELYSYSKELLYKELVQQFGVTFAQGIGADAAWSKLMDDATVKRQIAQASMRMRTDLKHEIGKALKSGKGLWETSRDIRDKALEGGADSGTAAEIGLKRLYKTPLEEQAKRISRRLEGGIKTDQLRYSYEKLVEAAENMDPVALIKQQEYTLKAKLKSHGERLHRTESARARHAVSTEKIAQDPHVKLVRVVLEARHHHTADICDAVAEADCGYGPGVYTLEACPALPLHPNCNCRAWPVYKVPKGAAPVKSPQTALNEASESLGINQTAVRFDRIAKKL